MRKADLRRSITAAGLALAATPALAVITWNTAPDATLFQDDNLDFALTVDTTAPGYDVNLPSTWVLVPDTLGGGGDGQLDPGDVLVAVVEYNTSAGVLIDTPTGSLELTGVAVTQYVGTDPLTGALNFQPYLGDINVQAPGGNFFLPWNSTPWDDSGNWNGDAMLALWLDSDPEMEIDAGLIPDGLSCYTLSACVAQASDGHLWEVDGFGVDLTGEPGEDNYWYAVGTGLLYDPLLTSNVATIRGFFNAGLDILYNGTGRPVFENGFIGDLGLPVDVLVEGTVNGGGYVGAPPPAALAPLVGDGYMATSDTDLAKLVPAVPAPATLALLGAGLMGFRVVRRKKA
jgi:hypothetical protein